MCRFLQSRRAGLEKVFGSANGRTLMLDSGTFSLFADAGASIPDLNIVVGHALLMIDAGQHLGDLSLSQSDSSVMVTSSGQPVVVRSLSILPGGVLDLVGNDLIVRNAAVGTWDGSRYGGLVGMVDMGVIQSSMAQPRTTMLAIDSASDVLGISGTQTGSFDGQTVGANDVLIKYTYAGDANLDGQINIDDYSRIDSQVGQSGLVFGWYNGEFNFDGKINIDDYGLIDSVIGSQSGVL